MPIVPEGYGQDGGGRGGTIGDYQGHFTATTVKQRAFDANDYILFDNGSKLDVFIAPEDIPINSPAPGESMSLWGGLIAQITSGVSRADFDAALARKANAASLANYLRTATYNLDKARIESGITGNDNDISALMTALDTLQTQVNNLPSGGGGGGDVTTAALNKAISDLRTALEASINQKQDADTAATDAELADSVSTLQRNINTLSTRVGNIPVSAEVLWATSKALTASLPAGRTVDTDWTIGDDVPTGVVVDGDILDIPENFRGDLHIDFVDSSDNLLQRKVIPITIGQTGFESPFGSRLRATIAQDRTDNTVLNFSLTTQSGRAVTIPGGTIAKIYGVTALPRSQVAAITQQQLTAAVAEIDDKFGGVPLNGPDAGETLSHVRIINFNKFIPEANWATVPVFSGLNLLRDALPAGVNFRDLGQYDRLLIRITFYRGAIASAVRQESFDFFVNVSEWDGLTTVPLPDQALAENASNRIQIIASSKDNRALVHEFPQVPPADVSDANTLRNSKRLIYVGKSNETNPRLLIGISGTNQDFLAEVKGYH